MTIIIYLSITHGKLDINKDISTLNYPKKTQHQPHMLTCLRFPNLLRKWHDEHKSKDDSYSLEH